MSPVYLFEWTFSPPDYFEEPFEVVRGDYRMTIGRGRVEAFVDCHTFDANPAIRDAIHKSLNDRFLGAQIISFRSYELSDPTRTRLHPDGRRDVFIELKGAVAFASGGTVDIHMTSSDGKVVYDSKRERIDGKKALSDLVATHKASDTTLGLMLRSHDAAVRDPQNELVHLYEIRDALSVQFGGKNAVIAVMGVSTSHWSRLGQLCNDEPLRQGRHRGKIGSALRDATEEELQEARGIARTMLQLYLGYLVRKASAPK